MHWFCEFGAAVWGSALTFVKKLLQIPLNFGFGLWKDVSAKVGSHEGDIC
jgi:hypothetical protein